MTRVEFAIRVDGRDLVVSEIDLGDDLIVRVGRWYWYRTPDGVLHEQVLEDQTFGPVTDAEVRRLLSRERRW